MRTFTQRQVTAFPVVQWIVGGCDGRPRDLPQASLVQRSRIQHSRDVKAIVRQIWKIVTSHKRKGHRNVSKHVYTQYLFAVHKHLVPDIDETEAWASIDVRGSDAGAQVYRTSLLVAWLCVSRLTGRTTTTASSR
jgi:hypothetical protein